MMHHGYGDTRNVTYSYVMIFLLPDVLICCCVFVIRWQFLHTIQDDAGGVAWEHQSCTILQKLAITTKIKRQDEAKFVLYGNRTMSDIGIEC